MLDLAIEAHGELLPTSPYSHYYIMVAKVLTWKELATLFAKVLHTRGIAPSPVPTSVPFDTGNLYEVYVVFYSLYLISY